MKKNVTQSSSNSTPPLVSPNRKILKVKRQSSNPTNIPTPPPLEPTPILSLSSSVPSPIKAPSQQPSETNEQLYSYLQPSTLTSSQTVTPVPSQEHLRLQQDYHQILINKLFEAQQLVQQYQQKIVLVEQQSQQHAQHFQQQYNAALDAVNQANEEKTALQHQIALLKSDKDKILSDLKTQNSVIEGMKDIHTKQERSLQNSLASINVELLKLRELAEKLRKEEEAEEDGGGGGGSHEWLDFIEELNNKMKVAEKEKADSSDYQAKKLKCEVETFGKIFTRNLKDRKVLRDKVAKLQQDHTRMSGQDLQSLKIGQLKELLAKHKQATRQVKAAIEAKMKEENSEEQCCVICLENPRQVVMIPCGHMSICSQCSSSANLKQCPLCRGPVLSLQRVYL